MIQRIPRIAEPVTPSSATGEAYFYSHLIYRPLPLRAAPCADCAVECGFYRDLSEDLRKCPPDLQEAASRRWFCHQNPSHACRGNANNLGLDWPTQPASTDRRGE